MLKGQDSLECRGDRLIADNLITQAGVRSMSSSSKSSDYPELFRFMASTYIRGVFYHAEASAHVPPSTAAGKHLRCPRSPFRITPHLDLFIHAPRLPYPWYGGSDISLSYRSRLQDLAAVRQWNNGAFRSEIELVHISMMLQSLSFHLRQDQKEQCSLSSITRSSQARALSGSENIRLRHNPRPLHMKDCRRQSPRHNTTCASAADF